MPDLPDPTPHLPLRPVDFYVLFVLGGEEQYGYRIVKEIAERSDGRIRLEPGNLYRYIRRLEEAGMVEDAGRRPSDEPGGERRRYYRITPFGGRVLAAEAERMRALAAAVDARFADAGGGPG